MKVKQSAQSLQNALIYPHSSLSLGVDKPSWNPQATGAEPVIAINGAGAFIPSDRRLSSFPLQSQFSVVAAFLHHHHRREVWIEREERRRDLKAETKIEPKRADRLKVAWQSGLLRHSVSYVDYRFVW